MRRLSLTRPQAAQILRAMRKWSEPLLLLLAWLLYAATLSAPRLASAFR